MSFRTTCYSDRSLSLTGTSTSICFTFDITHHLLRTQAIDAHTIYPFIHTFSNIPNRDALLRSISFPDVLPSSLPPSANFSLVAGKPPGLPLSISSKLNVHLHR